MCQSTEDDMSNALMEAKPDFKYSKKLIKAFLHNFCFIYNLTIRVFRKCLKCDNNSVVVTRINEALCK